MSRGDIYEIDSSLVGFGFHIRYIYEINLENLFHMRYICPYLRFFWSHGIWI